MASPLTFAFLASAFRHDTFVRLREQCTKAKLAVQSLIMPLAGNSLAAGSVTRLYQSNCTCAGSTLVGIQPLQMEHFSRTKISTERTTLRPADGSGSYRYLRDHLNCRLPWMASCKSPDSQHTHETQIAYYLIVLNDQCLMTQAPSLPIFDSYFWDSAFFF